jgi:Pyruvate/2-oxoacid:ferredoxin oxidoreductase delta subunit|tara:strand:- start:10016 stop:11020 length:1005 start_codon:yes stop_codon:yes gene_type:complete
MAQETVYTQLAEAIGAGDSPRVPRLFQMIANEDEAKVILAASPPASAVELADKAGLGADDVGEMVDPLFKKGLLFKSSKPDANGGTRYYRVRALLQFHDSSVLAPDVDQDFLELWREYQENEFLTYHKRLESRMQQSSMRVVPVNVALEPDTTIAPFEDVKQIVAKARNLAVVNCPCRIVEGAPCEKPMEVCIQVDKAADYTLDRGSGRGISKTEAIGILEHCEEEGLVHMVGNSRGLGHIICNCCEDCCIAWPGPRTADVNFAAPSRFTAVLDSDRCTDCEVCLDRCHFDAITMEDNTLIAADECMGCGLCAVVCPTEAISLQETREQAFVPG